MNIFIVVPAYNEGQRIKKVVELLLTKFSNVIVVNDGSKDNTGEEIKSLPIYYCEHAVNLGQGAGLKTGTELAIGLGAEVIVHADADGQHRLEDIEKLVIELEKGNADIVIGSRFLGVKSNMPKRKKIILFLAKLFVRLFFRIKITDPQSGLRAFRASPVGASAWPKIKFTYDDFRHCTEILFLIKKNRLKFVEVPIKVNYDEHSCNKKLRPKIKMAAELLLDKLIK
ncbi:glycosyltransferase family 2 protein [Candidatus Falkowbacteria bacterium]|nr:glycosyltransferase family 2 protein [Candidatus Falkowbacteria bacterium]